jgi:1-acyl-sn-glycerol-3-phosphate acyltransferase
MQGYYRNQRATEAIYHHGWLDSGDLAYMADGEVFITGRRKDLIIKAGRNLYPVEIEEMVGVIPGVREGCVSVFGVTDKKDATEDLVVVAETREKNKAKRAEIIDKIKETISTSLDIVPDKVVLVSPHTVPKTSSGKLQRAACKKLYMEGKLDKRHVPAWLQITSLGMQGTVRKCFSGIRLLGKAIYTFYVVVVFTLVLAPVYILIRFAKRDVAARTCHTAAKLLLKLSLCPVRVDGFEKLTQVSPVIFTPNHTSYFDSLVMLALMPCKTHFVVKKEIFTTPVLRTFARALDCISVDRMDLSKGVEDTKNIEKCLKAGNPILIFPEGTFSYASGLRPFRLGAFKIAVETDTPICPIALKGTRTVLRDDEKLMRPNQITVTVCDLVKPSGSEWKDVTHLRNAVRNEIAKYCGEPSLEHIAAKTVAPKRTE